MGIGGGHGRREKEGPRAGGDQRDCVGRQLEMQIGFFEKLVFVSMHGWGGLVFLRFLFAWATQTGGQRDSVLFACGWGGDGGPTRTQTAN